MLDVLVSLYFRPKNTSENETPNWFNHKQSTNINGKIKWFAASQESLNVFGYAVPWLWLPFLQPINAD